MKERIAQYNAAGTALEEAVQAVRSATDETLPDAEAKFREAQAEYQRCEANLHLAEEADAIPAFTPKPAADPNKIGMSDGEARSFSFLRAINALITGDWSKAGLERAASDAVAAQLGRSAQGFFVPTDVQHRADLNATDATYAGNLIGTDLLGGSFTDLLRNAMKVRAAGATVLGGLQGNIAIPRQTAGATSYWVGENTAITAESYPTVDQITMTPHAHGAYTDISRQLILQSSVDVEQLVRRDLATVLGLGLDLAALAGTNANDQPLGIAGTGNVGSVVGGTNGAAPTWANIVDLETQVAVDNADVANMAYMVNAVTRGYLKSTPKVASTGDGMMWENGSTPLNGYAAHVSNQIVSNLTKASGSGLSRIYFGNWADLIIGLWGSLDILVDPYTGATAGTVRIVALEDVDIAVRHPESFAVMADADC